MADIYNMTDTWNDGGTSFEAIKMNVTDTASDASSKLMDLQIGGTSRASIGKDGGVIISPTVTGVTPVLSVRTGADTFGMEFQTNSTANTGRLMVAGDGVGITDSSGVTRKFSISQYGIRACSDRRLQWSNSTTNPDSGIDAGVMRGGVNMVKITDGLSGSGALLLTEMTAPTAVTDGCILYADDSGGKTRLMARFASGADQQIAIEP